MNSFKVYSGHWGGTMQLAEPEAGSDVGALTTAAKKNADGTYSISGNKTFITCGDQNLTENIIHPVLARIEGAPQGTKGISLFLVPKFWVNDDGNYIVDFYCPAAKLIVEVDGGQHYISADNQKDKVRDQYLDNLGFKVLRFSNRDIFKNIDGVLQKIYDYL